MTLTMKAVTGAILATFLQSAFLLAADGVDSPAAPAAELTSEPPADGPAADDPGKAGTSTSDDQWHISFSPYLWLPGVHGDVGALGRNVGFKASPADLLSHFRLGVLGAVEARRKRLLLSTDLMYLRLNASNALPFEKLSAISANITANTVLLTPKIGVRMVDQEKLKIDFTTGFRFWYFGENLNFSPSALGLNYSASQSWISPLVGGRIEMPLSPKVAVIILGDVGGWGEGSQLEYQWVGVIGYKIKPKWTLQAGYRYLNADYKTGGNLGGVVNLTMSGVVFGLTGNLSKE
jgi:hypothetical protein